MDFTLITIAAAEAYRVDADSIEISQHRHFNNKLQLWAVCRIRRSVVWTTWMYL